jgi:hypothetical protein
MLAVGYGLDLRAGSAVWPCRWLGLCQAAGDVFQFPTNM